MFNWIVRSVTQILQPMVINILTYSKAYSCGEKKKYYKMETQSKYQWQENNNVIKHSLGITFWELFVQPTKSLISSISPTIPPSMKKVLLVLMLANVGKSMSQFLVCFNQWINTKTDPCKTVWWPESIHGNRCLHFFFIQWIYQTLKIKRYHGSFNHYLILNHF